MPTTTRVAAISDLDAIASLFDAYRQFYQQPADLALARSFIQARLQREESVIILAEDDAQSATGFCQLYPIFCSLEAKPIYSLSDLFVVPSARRGGFGRALLKTAELVASRHRKAKMELPTARTNSAAQAAYESLGWQRDEVFIAYSKAVA